MLLIPSDHFLVCFGVYLVSSGGICWWPTNGLLASTHRWCAVIVGHIGLTVDYDCLNGALGCTCPWRVSNMLVHPHPFLVLFWPIILFRKVFCRCYWKFFEVWICIFFVLHFLEFCMIKYFLSVIYSDRSFGFSWKNIIPFVFIRMQCIPLLRVKSGDWMMYR